MKLATRTVLALSMMLASTGKEGPPAETGIKNGPAVGSSKDKE